MKRSISVLVLTDHRGHNSDNSLYALCSELRRNPKVGAVHIASRGNPANNRFFYQFQNIALRAWPLDGEMNYRDADYRFMQETIPANIKEYDWIWLRLPRPIPDGFFDFLAREVDERQIFNSPSGIEETSNKAFLANFADICPPLQLCPDVDSILNFQEQFPIVLKPLENYGGRGVVKVENGFFYENDKKASLQEYLPVLEQQFQLGGYMGMKFLRNVTQGDKRIIVVNGDVVGAVLRLPPKGAWLCNAAQGGQAAMATADARELQMARQMADVLLPKGIAMFGMDTLVEDDGRRVLSEVNTLSIGGIKPLEDLTGKPMIKRTTDLLTDYMAAGTNLQRPALVS
ncbi:MAG: glutathione synthetase [Phaeodactylibacter sp.]|nr:glutathione synthetase [Phaeodactylibacter sp.]MCB9049998.1 glutathione synthetase [Lewinellaceae bacterium]